MVWKWAVENGNGQLKYQWYLTAKHDHHKDKAKEKWDVEASHDDFLYSEMQIFENMCFQPN